MSCFCGAYLLIADIIAPDDHGAYCPVRESIRDVLAVRDVEDALDAFLLEDQESVDRTLVPGLLAISVVMQPAPGLGIAEGKCHDPVSPHPPGRPSRFSLIWRVAIDTIFLDLIDRPDVISMLMSAKASPDVAEGVIQCHLPDDLPIRNAAVQH